MTAHIETTIRGPEAFALARQAVEAMAVAGVWPTPLNFELWLHYIGDPDGALGVEMRRLLESKEPFTEATAEMLAAEYLPRGRLSEEIRDAGAVLNRELASVTEAIASAQRSQQAYGQTLAGASDEMAALSAPPDVQQLVVGLASATDRVQRENAELEKRLARSTSEVARLNEHLEQVRRDAMTDALTNLANRKAFDDALDLACAVSEQQGLPLTLAVLDIDHFKTFNDTWGHQTGDQVLRYVASVIGRVARDPRIAARYGGEEFAIIFPSELATMVEVTLNDIRTEIASRALRRRSTNDELGAVTVSIGLAQRHAGEDAASLLDRADTALYTAKRGGRNRVSNAEPIAAAA